MELVNHYNKNFRGSQSEYLDLGSLRVSQINFFPNHLHRLPERSLQHKNHQSYHQSQSVQIPFHQHQSKKSHLRFKTQPTQELQQTRILAKQNRINLPKNSSQPLQVESNGRMKSFFIEKHLQQRAKQFVEKVTQQKSRIQGRLFLLKQKEQERRSLKEQLEECEHTLIKTYYRLQRKAEAEQHIKRFQERAQQRQSKSISKKEMTNKSINCLNNKSKETHNKKGLALARQGIEANAFEVATKSKTKGSYPFLLTNERYLSDEDRQVSLMKKMLLQLKNLMKREQHFKTNDSVLFS